MDDQVVVKPRAQPPRPPPLQATPTAHRTMKVRIGWLAIVVLLLLAAGAGAWRWMGRAGEAVHYTNAQVTRGIVSRAVTATGTVNPELTIMVGTYVSGVIQHLYCDYNTKVKAGQICAKIDPRPYQVVVDQDKANLTEAKAQLEKDKANLAYTKLNYERNRWLVEHQSASLDAADIAKNAYDQAQAQVGLDQAIIAQREAALEAAQVNLGYTDIVSPVDGTVVSRNVTQGQTVAASFQTPTLFLIATDLTKMQVDTNVSESDIGGMKDGDAATFTVDAYPNRVFEGKVAQVRQSPQTVQNVVTFDVVVGVNNSDLALKPGMTASTRIIVDQRTDVLRVPNQALRYTPRGLAGVQAQTPVAAAPAANGPAGVSGGTRVWVLRNGQPVSISVVTGLDDDSYTEIVKGDLRAGDRVIVSEQRGAAGASSAAKSGPPGPRF